MRGELIRAEVVNLVRTRPFQTFVLTFESGERAVIEHPEYLAFDPRPGSATDFFVRTGGLRMYSTFDAVTSIALLANVSGNGPPAQASTAS